jgi:ribosomal protein L12E/L44/L45/RPP1/RPP2
MVDVSFVSKPTGAAVLFYGMPAGRTPMTTKLAPGDYRVTVSAVGMQDWVQQFSVEPAKPVSLVAELKPRPLEQVTQNGNQITLPPPPPVQTAAPAAAPAKKPARRKKGAPANEASAEMPKIIVGHAK